MYQFSIIFWRQLKVGARRKAREYAFQMLFQLDFDRDDCQDKLKQFWRLHNCSPEVKEFAESLVNGTLKHLEQIDERISGHSLNWRLCRMSVVDRNILRLSSYEILFCDDIPVKVSINEALEIAKKYSASESASFINGILDKIANPQ